VGEPIPSAKDAALEAGAVLAELHASRLTGIRPFGPDAQLEAAAASARLIGAIAPELRQRVDRLLASLSASMPDTGPLVPSHGDFHVGQLIETHDGLAVIDFDEMCLAPRALDPATYAAHIVRGGDGDLDAAHTALEPLLQGYGSRPDGLSWYLSASILRRGPFPFRYFHADWRPRIEEMVACAQEALVP
jgi:Ser/Thr protein kinase RdoA (MazF antagonist)